MSIYEWAKSMKIMNQIIVNKGISDQYWPKNGSIDRDTNKFMLPTTTKTTTIIIDT